MNSTNRYSTSVIIYLCLYFKKKKASTTLFHLDQRVSIAGKGLGTIAFIGKTEFADDRTFLRYFTCNDNHGLYVRPGHIESVISNLQSNLTRSSSNHSIQSEGSTGSIPPSSTSTIPRTSAVPTKQRGLRAPTLGTTTKLLGSDGDIDQTDKLSYVISYSNSFQSFTDIPTAVATERILSPKEEIKSPVSQLKTTTSMVKEKKKRRDDFEKLKEFERTKLQLDQLQTYKRETQERIKELNDKLQQ
ncbi:unnamed protein product [Rotaria sordida]|uniref:CAP-Gly domain-containing protein n=1 Tax=Rotaria sordida TaxID=392033 RepID=A0A819CEW8_9BILA|nr:unnamed protein product [Rotaria sordida]